MGVFEERLSANRRFAATRPILPAGPLPAKAFALVTCMDTRVEPLAALGLRPGDAKILRNAGGRVTPDVLRSLVLATTMLGVRAVVVMHHTGCALAGKRNEDIRADLRPAQQAASARWCFGAMPDPDAALAADVAAVRDCAALAPGVAVEGWRYDVTSGLADRVIPAPPPS